MGMGIDSARLAQRRKVGGERKAHYLLCFHPNFQRVVFLLQFCIGGCEVFDSLVVVSFRFCEVGGFGLQVFDAGG